MPTFQRVVLSQPPLRDFPRPVGANEAVEPRRVVRIDGADDAAKKRRIGSRQRLVRGPAWAPVENGRHACAKRAASLRSTEEEAIAH